MTKVKKEQLITYLIDCLGYSESQDIKGLSYNELMDLVDDKEELISYTK